MEIYVFMVGGDICRFVYGNGVVFVDAKNKARYDKECNYEYFGTLEKFIKYVKKEVKEHGELNLSYIE